jgi:hypothetical protein
MTGKRSSAARRGKGAKARITTKQKSARRKNIAIARKSKKKGNSRASEEKKIKAAYKQHMKNADKEKRLRKIGLALKAEKSGKYSMAVMRKKMRKTKLYGKSY